MQSRTFSSFFFGLALATLGALVFADPTPPAKQLLDNPLEPLTPKEARSEADEDRLAAIAHFSAGRMLEQRQQSPEALREYERAIRYDSDAAAVLRELIPLAFSLDRPDEGLRYAVKYVEQNPIDSELLERAAEYLAESGQWSDALKLYKQAALQSAKDKPSPQRVAVQMEIGRLSFLTDQYADSAAAFKQVMEALANPEKFGIDAVAHKTLLGEGGATYDLMGEVFLEAKQPENAKDAFEQFNKIRPDARVFALNMARVDLAAEKPQEALDKLQACLKPGDDRNDESTGANDEKQSSEERPKTATYETLAKVLKELKQDDQLIAKLEALQAGQPKNTALNLFLGEQYATAGEARQSGGDACHGP